MLAPDISSMEVSSRPIKKTAGTEDKNARQAAPAKGAHAPDDSCAMPPVLPVYKRADIAIVRGEGAYLYDDTGRRYLDFMAGIAVSSLGHCHPHVVRALTEQAQTLWHCSNRFRIPEQERLAQRLTSQSFADTAFFCSSGVEAIECGIKMIRRHFHHKGQPNRYRVITVEGCFHGRSMTAISAASKRVSVRF